MFTGFDVADEMMIVSFITKQFGFIGKFKLANKLYAHYYDAPVGFITGMLCRHDDNRYYMQRGIHLSMNGQLNEIQLLENSKLSPHPPPTWERKSFQRPAQWQNDRICGAISVFRETENAKKKKHKFKLSASEGRSQEVRMASN